MPTDDEVRAFSDLFAGRTDAWGESLPDGSVICRHEEVTEDHYRRHLEGVHDMGVYCVRPDNTCKWGCVDIDFDDLGLARRLSDVLDRLGISAVIEKSKSKGYHVWVFCTQFIPARDMRRTLLVACELIDYSPREVNPKRETGDVMGNFVRLPLSMTWCDMATPLRRRIIDGCLGEAPASVFAEWASHHRPPRRLRTQAFGPTPHDVAALLNRDGMQKIRHIHNNGPLEGRDRSDTLYKLACLCREAGLGVRESLGIIESADRTSFQKYVERPDADQRYNDLVERAFS